LSLVRFLLARICQELGTVKPIPSKTWRRGCPLNLSSLQFRNILITPYIKDKGPLELYLSVSILHNMSKSVFCGKTNCLAEGIMAKIKLLTTRQINTLSVWFCCSFLSHPG